MTAALQIGALAEAVVTAFGIAGTGWAVAKWVNRPRFICGIPPAPEEQKTKRIDPKKIGHASVSHGYRHRSRCFAHRLRRRHKRALSRRDLRKTADPLRCRTIRVGDDGVAAFPVLIANSGHRIALDYTVSIIFLEHKPGTGPHLVDVLTESLEFNLYVSDPSTLRRDELRNRLSAEAIRDDYSYMPERGVSIDGIYLSGSVVEAGSYELVHVEAQLGESAEEFFVLYTVSCSDGWMRDVTYVQRCVVSPAGASPLGERAPGADARPSAGAEPPAGRPLGPGTSGGPGKARRHPYRRGRS